MRAGGVILYPTDTVWGIGCDATNTAAVEKVYRIKKREDSKALILLVDSMAKIQSYVGKVPDIAWDLVEVAESPLTIIYDKVGSLPENLLGKDGSIAIRVTTEQFSKKLCERMKVPVVSTSANVSGEETPRCFDEISEDIISQVDYVVDYRKEDKSKPQPSSIIKLSDTGVIKIIRE